MTTRHAIILCLLALGAAGCNSTPKKQDTAALSTRLKSASVAVDNVDRRLASAQTLNQRIDNKATVVLEWLQK